jgi:PAS domain S-box-containing protein
MQLGPTMGVAQPDGYESKDGLNTTTASQAESLLAAGKRTLEMIASGSSLSEVLNDLCVFVEAYASPVTSLICLKDGERLSPFAGPRVPATIKTAIKSWTIGPKSGPCGAAAFTKQRVIIPDTSDDPRWPDEARDLARNHGFGAAWSEPLVSSDGEVLGTFCLSYAEPRIPNSQDLELIELASHIALIAIELERSHRTLQAALVDIKHSENRLSTIIDTIPALAWSARPDGSAEFFNRRWLDYAGLSAEEASDWGWTAALHPGDRDRLVDHWQHLLAFGEAGEIEARLRRFDGEYRYFLFRASPLRNDLGKIVKWYGTNTDIEDRKRAEDALRTSERNARLIVDSIPGLVCTLSADGEVQFLNRQVLEYFGKTTETLKNWATSDAVHPDDLPRAIDAWKHSIQTGQSYVLELRHRRADGAYRWFQSVALPARVPEGPVIAWYMLLTDIDDRKRAEDALRSNEQSLRMIVDSIPGFVSTLNAAGEVELQNRQVLEYTGKTADEMKNWGISETLHPDDLPRVIDAWRRAIKSGEPIDLEHRSRGADGVYRWFHARGRPQRDAEGRIVRWYNLVTDIDERKRAEGELTIALKEKAKSEAELSRIIDAIPQIIVALSPDGNFLWTNQALLEYTGLTKEELGSENFRSLFHPEDSERLRDQRAAALSRGVPFEYEWRVRHRDGQYRWFLVQYNPLRDERGEVIRWYATGTDIDDRKRAEERTRQENVALREQIDQVFMFEEIVGSSPALKTVVSSLVKVAPTDSTVLITGETGTGKELIARAIHTGSQRADRAFITVNCASLPTSLIASELFGHEKGAFTGALQRRQGRFELANGGTIFLDEIGELPAETQVALLRVLQDRKFERVGGTQSIQVDVRVVAATNRDLEAAMANGTFRADLFYRLNVFPIQMPPLRERQGDILTLLEYFVQRFGRKLGKTFSKIDKRTVELFRSYDWPGNVRELQNVVERSVIVSPDDVFCVDEAWLTTSNAANTDVAKSRLRQHVPELTNDDSGRERQIIETALAESRGRVYGTTGAAAKLRIPPSTLDSKIKKLQIRKNRFKLC